MKRSGAATLVGVMLSVLAGCGGGGHAVPDGGDARGDGDASGDGGGGTAIVVDTASGVMATATEDGHCDLLEAALAAASGLSVGDCANPHGVARIVLQPGSTYPLPRTLRLSGATELGVPDGQSGIATIAAAPGFVVDARDASSACLVSVGDVAAQVSVHDVTLTGDPNLTIAGACISKGMLNVRRARVTGFKASGLVATCLPVAGCDHEGDTQQAATLRLFDSLVDGNRTAGKGGGVSSEGSGATVYIAHSAIVNNQADYDGGGVYLGGGWATNIIESSTLSDNTSSGAGGGVLVRFAEKTNTYTNIIGCTIANNTAASTGGGIEFDPAQVGTQDVSVFSSIVAGNYSTSTFEWNINSAWSPTGLFNCVNGSFIYVLPGNPRPTDMGGCKMDVRNPLLGPLTPLGGPMQRPLHPLLAGSLAIDGAVGAATVDDQRDDWIDGVDPASPPAWTVFEPLVDGDGDGTAVRDLGAYEVDDRSQTELLAVRAQGPATHTVVTIPVGYDRGAGTAYAASSATGEFVTYALPISEAGYYDLTIGVRQDSDAGKFQVAVAESPAGPWTPVGTEQDAYATGSAFASLGPLPTPLFASPGEKLLRFSVTGKNTASSGYRLYLDFVDAKKRATACPVAALAAGGNHTCARLASGAVRCWGGNESGQLGDGASTGRASPPAVDVGSGVAALAAGGSHTCALSTEGGVRCWGGNGNGQLGDGTTTARPTPPTTAVLSGVAAIAAGRSHTCALTTSGGVRCWGANGDGQLGDGTTTDRPQPPTTDVLTGVQAIAAGGSHTCALMVSGGVRCWGANGNGQLGDGTMVDRSAPPAADVGGGFAAVSAGDTHTCALTAAGGVRCWGHNADGELGIGRYDVVSSPPAADALTGVKQVVASNVFTCALLTSGGVRCWGYNSHGEIGDDTVLAVDRLSPAATDILGGVTSIAAGAAHVCAVMAAGGVRCWGANDSGQLGDGMAPILALTPPAMDNPGFTGTCQ